MSKTQKEYFESVEKERLLISKLANLKVNDPAIPNPKELKAKLETELRETSRKRGELRETLDIEDAQKAIDYSKTLLTENLEKWVFESDYGKLPINPKSLTVELVYQPCKHKETLSLGILIPFEKSYHWEALCNGSSDSISSVRFCQKCREEKQTLKDKFSRYNEKPVGHASWKIRFLK